MKLYAITPVSKSRSSISKRWHSTFQTDWMKRWNWTDIWIWKNQIRN